MIRRLLFPEPTADAISAQKEAVFMPPFAYGAIGLAMIFSVVTKVDHGTLISGFVLVPVLVFTVRFLSKARGWS